MEKGSNSKAQLWDIVGVEWNRRLFLGGAGYYIETIIFSLVKKSLWAWWQGLGAVGCFASAFSRGCWWVQGQPAAHRGLGLWCCSLQSREIWSVLRILLRVISRSVCIYIIFMYIHLYKENIPISSHRWWWMVLMMVTAMHLLFFFLCFSSLTAVKWTSNSSSL